MDPEVTGVSALLAASADAMAAILEAGEAPGPNPGIKRWL